MIQGKLESAAIYLTNILEKQQNILQSVIRKTQADTLGNDFKFSVDAYRNAQSKEHQEYVETKWREAQRYRVSKKSILKNRHNKQDDEGVIDEMQVAPIFLSR